MGVYWFKVYLKTEQFGWVHHETPQDDGCRRRQTRLCHIPGQYLQKDSVNKDEVDRYFIPKEDDVESFLMQRVLEDGVAGVHYAASYLGIYNMIRQFGKFELDNQSGDVVLVGYQGPDLPVSGDDKE